MIDVVFLLLVFFMLAARFGADEAISLSPTVSGSDYSGPPRLVSIGPDVVRLNGQTISLGDLSEAVSNLTSSVTDAVVLQPESGVDLQALVRVMTTLHDAGFTNIVVIE